MLSLAFMDALTIYGLVVALSLLFENLLFDPENKDPLHLVITLVFLREFPYSVALLGEGSKHVLKLKILP